MKKNENKNSVMNMVCNFLFGKLLMARLEEMDKAIDGLDEELQAQRNYLHGVETMKRKLKEAKERERAATAALESERAAKQALEAERNAMLQEKYEGGEYIVEQDAGGNLFCGKCMLGYNYCKKFLGKRVRLSSIVPNTNKLGAGYPVFATCVVLAENN